MDSNQMFQTLKTERYYSQDEILDKRKVKVYIRTVSQKAIKIELPSEMKIAEIKQIIQNRLNIPIQNQILYLKGVCVNFNVLVLLENNWIIHAINKLEVDLPEISVSIRTKINKKSQETPQKYTFDPKIKTKQFIQNFIINNYQISQNEVMLIESGRILRQNLTFLQQNVQSQTTINLMNSAKDLKPPAKNVKPQPLLLQTAQNSKTPSMISNYKSQEKPISLSQLDGKLNQKNNKITKNKFCQIHQMSANQSVVSESPTKAKTSRLMRKDSFLRSSLTLKSKPILIGQRQCDCKKEVKGIKSPRFVTEQDKKKLSQQIRQQNMNKFLKSKIRKDKNIVENEPTPKKKLMKTNSLKDLQFLSLNQKSKSLKQISNPQKA